MEPLKNQRMIAIEGDLQFLFRLKFNIKILDFIEVLAKTGQKKGKMV